MMLQLKDIEKDLLIDLLTASIAEIRQEIYRTEDHDFKNAVRARKVLMEELLHKINLPEYNEDPRNVEFIN
jgi:hypothetical protein